MNIDPVTEEDKGGSGAILAHCMGLGKTFTTITLIHTLFRYPKLTHIRRVLILCPLNTATKSVENRIVYQVSSRCFLLQLAE